MMNDKLKKKLESDSELKRKIDLIVINHFPMLPENARVELVDLKKTKKHFKKCKKRWRNWKVLRKMKKMK